MYLYLQSNLGKAVDSVATSIDKATRDVSKDLDKAASGVTRDVDVAVRGASKDLVNTVASPLVGSSYNRPCMQNAVYVFFAHHNLQPIKIFAGTKFVELPPSPSEENFVVFNYVLAHW